MDLKHRFLIKFLMGGVIGMLICVTIMFLSMSAEEIDSQGLEVLRQLAGAFLYGSFAMGGSVAYEIESWGIVRATATHYIASMSALLIVNHVLGWFGYGPGLILAFAGLTLVYVLIWVIQAVSSARRVREVNEELRLLSQRKDDTDENDGDTE